MTEQKPMEGTLAVQPSAFVCPNYTQNGRISRVIAVVFPTKIKNEEGGIRVIWYCGSGTFCENRTCILAHGGRHA